MGEKSDSPRLFPPQMDAGLEFKWSKTYCLGTPNNKKMFCVDFPRGMFKRDRPLAVLHAGPSEKDPPLAIADYEPGNKKTQIITIPPRPGSGRDTEVVAKMTPYIGGWMDITHSFFAPCGPEGKLEEFQWRLHENDPNIKAIGSYGFNLHWISGGKEEVVAIMAMGKSMSMSKWYTFAFVGEGLAGTFGDDWEIAAVMGGIRTYYLEDLRVAGATAA